mgnify:CR=1 FL=1
MASFFIQYRDLAGIMIFSLVIKVILASIGEVINPDGVLYIAAAQQYAAGNFSEGIQIYPMPVFPMLIAGVHWLIPDWLAAARTITITSMVLASIPLYKLTEHLFHRRAAFWATIFLAVAPEANENALRVLRDPTFVLLALTALLFVVNGFRSRSLGWMASALAVAGSTLLFRVEGIVIVAAPPIFLVLLCFAHKDAEVRSFARKSVAFWLGIPLAAGIVLTIVVGPQILNQNRIDFIVGEVRAVAGLSAFDKYRQIYAYFKDIQDQPPFSGFSHSLPATVRHWMPVIYLVGLLESLVKQLYPLFLVPLAMNFKKIRTWRMSLEKAFILLVFTVYFLALFFVLITKDKMVGRLLFTPVILLYPWVGHGFDKGLKALRDIKLAPLVQALVILLFIFLPCAKAIGDVLGSDRSAVAVGKSIRQDTNLRDAKFLFSESSHWLYARKLEDFAKARKIAIQIGEHLEAGQEEGIETLALEHDVDTLVLFVNKQKNQKIPLFERFAPYKHIDGEKGVTVIYRSVIQKEGANPKVKD